MRNDLFKRKLYIGGVMVLFLAVFGYFTSFLMGRIAFLEGEYLSKQSGLLALEQKQKQATLLSKELLQIQDKKKEVLEALLSQQYEDKLILIVQLEDAAKSVGLTHELQVVKELTQEEINREKELILRSRRGSQRQAGEEEEERLPGITLEINLKGSYEGFVKFLEKLQSFPYYMRIEQLNVSREAEQEERGAVKLKGAIRVAFFSKA